MLQSGVNWVFWDWQLKRQNNVKCYRSWCFFIVSFELNLRPFFMVLLLPLNLNLLPGLFGFFYFKLYTFFNGVNLIYDI